MIGEYYNIDGMKLMPRYPDKHFDLAIVDPPYGIGANKFRFGDGSHGIKVNYLDKKEWDKSPPPEKYFNELFRVSKNQIICGGNYFNLPPTRCFIFWDKGGSMEGRDYADGELLWTSFDKVARVFRYNPTHGGKRTKIHINQKPVKLYEWLLTNYAKPNDLILDTHCGSASSLIACENLGFKYVASELDPDYYKQSKERLEKHLAQGKLFEPRELFYNQKGEQDLL